MYTALGSVHNIVEERINEQLVRHPPVCLLSVDLQRFIALTHIVLMRNLITLVSGLERDGSDDGHRRQLVFMLETIYQWLFRGDNRIPAYHMTGLVRFYPSLSLTGAIAFSSEMLYTAPRLDCLSIRPSVPQHLLEVVSAKSGVLVRAITRRKALRGPVLSTIKFEMDLKMTCDAICMARVGGINMVNNEPFESEEELDQYVERELGMVFVYFLLIMIEQCSASIPAAIARHKAAAEARYVAECKEVYTDPEVYAKQEALKGKRPRARLLRPGSEWSVPTRTQIRICRVNRHESVLRAQIRICLGYGLQILICLLVGSCV